MGRDTTDDDCNGGFFRADFQLLNAVLARIGIPKVLNGANGFSPGAMGDSRSGGMTIGFPRTVIWYSRKEASVLEKGSFQNRYWAKEITGLRAS
jgi:hypothetical protein